MEFKTKKQLMLFLKTLKIIGMGSQGVCYYNSKDKYVYKLFHQFFDDDGDIEYHVTYEEKEILRFSDIKNETFIWSRDVISVNGEIVGYKVPYLKADNLYKCNPLRFNLDKLQESVIVARNDIGIISERHVLTYDMMYNILYGNKFFVIDHDEYSYSDKDSSVIRRINYENFDMEIYYFLVDGLFQKFVNDNKMLSELYSDKKEDVLFFLKLFRNLLSEMVGKEIVTLGEASKYIDKKVISCHYQRKLVK